MEGNLFRTPLISVMIFHFRVIMVDFRLLPPSPGSSISSSRTTVHGIYWVIMIHPETVNVELCPNTSEVNRARFNVTETLRHREIDPVLLMKGSFVGVFSLLLSVHQLEVWAVGVRWDEKSLRSLNPPSPFPPFLLTTLVTHFLVINL